MQGHLNRSQARRVACPRAMAMAGRLALLLLNLLLVTGAASAQDAPGNLANLTLEELMKVTVTSASRKEQIAAEVPAAVYVITRDDIRRAGMSTIPEILRLAPGVHVAQLNSNKWAVTIRGFNALYANKLLVLIDGRSIYNRLFAGVTWDAEDLVLEDIERIEVIRGPGAAMWGTNAVNGVINIVTRPAASTEGLLAKVTGGTSDVLGLTMRYGAPIGSGSYRVFTQLSDRGHLRSIGDSTQSAGDDWHHLVFGGKADWAAGRDAFMLQSSVQSNRSRAMWLDLGTEGTGLADRGGSRLASAYALGRWTRTISPRWSFQLQSHVEIVDRHEPVGHYERHAIETDAEYRLRAGRQDVNFGAGYRRTTEGFAGANGYSMLPPEATEGLITAFAQDEVSWLSGRLRVSGGARLEHAGYLGTSYQPTVRTMWQPANRHYVWGAVSRALRTPSLSDRYIHVAYPPQPGPNGLPLAVRLSGNPELTSERLISNEAGYRVELASAAFVDVTVFHGRYKDLRSTEALAPFLEFNGPTPVIVAPVRFGNQLDARTRGMEVAGHWTPVSDWRIGGSYSFLRITPYPQRSSADLDAAASDGRVPSHQWNAHATGWIGRHLLVSATLFRVGRIASMDTPAYARLDTRVELRLPRRLSIAATGRNLTSASHVEFPGADSNLTGSRVPRSADISLIWRR